MNPSRKGDFAEHYAITWLWDQGYEVFKNVGCTGPIDLIGMKNGQTCLFDVKTYDGSRTDWGGNSRTDVQKFLGVRHIRFDYTTRELSFVEHRV